MILLRSGALSTYNEAAPGSLLSHRWMRRIAAKSRHSHYQTSHLPDIAISTLKKIMLPANIPRDFVPIFGFINKLSRPITLALEMVPQEIELAPGDEVQVFVYKDDSTLPIHMELGGDYLQIYPHQSWGNWYVYKNGDDVSGEPYRTPITQPRIGD